MIGYHPEHTGQTLWTDTALLTEAGIETVMLGPKGCGLREVSPRDVDIYQFL